MAWQPNSFRSALADLHTASTLRRLLTKILLGAQTWLGVETSRLLLKDAQTAKFKVYMLKKSASHHLMAGLTQPPPDITEWVLATGKSVLIHESHDTLKSLDHPQGQDRLAVPLISLGKTLGVLFLTNRLAPGPFRKLDLSRLEIWAENAAHAIHNFRRLEAQRRFTQELKRQIRATSIQLRRANEKLRQAQQIKSEQISMVAHEIRSPITSIAGFAKLLLKEQNGPLNQKQTSFCSILLKNAENLERLINDLLDLSKLELGRLEMQRKVISCQDLLQEAVSSLPAGLPNKPQRLQLEIPVPELYVQGDRLRLLQVLNNLLTNALKYSPLERPVTIGCQAADTKVIFSVEDQGQSLSAEQRKIIFEKFIRLKSSGGESALGSGLGLAICKTIIELHAGEVWVETSPRGGNIFRFCLPRVKGP